MSGISIFDNNQGVNSNISPTNRTGINAFSTPIGYPLPPMDPLHTDHDGSSYGQGYVPSIYTEEYYKAGRDPLREYLANNQSDWDKFGNMLARGSMKFGVSMVEPIPYILDIEQYTTNINEIENEYGNIINTGLRNLESSIDEAFPIYTEKEQPKIFSADWWYKNGDQMLKSMGYFVPGIGITKVLNSAFKGIGVGLNTSKFLGLLGGSIAQNYSEHMYSAAITFEQNKEKYLATIKEQNPTLSNEEALHQAKILASKDAEDLLVRGKVNILLNMIELNNLVKIPLARSADGINKSMVANILSNFVSEGLEEMNTGVFEAEAQRNADIYSGKVRDDGSTPLHRILRHYASYEGLTEGLLGAIGGAGMQIVSELSSLGARKAARDMQGQIMGKYNDPNSYDKTKRNEFVESLFHAAQTGTYGTMMSVLEDVRNLDETTAKERGFRPDYKETLDEYIDIAKNFEVEYNTTLHKYSERPELGLHLVNLRTNRDVNRRLALKNEGLINNTKTQYTEGEKAHPLFAAKDLYLQSQAIQSELAGIETDLKWLEESKEFDRTLDNNESIEDLTKRKEQATERLNKLNEQYGNTIVEFAKTREKELKLNIPYAPGLLTNEQIQSNIEAEVSDYMKQLNKTDLQLKELYKELGSAQSISNVAAKTVSELERNNKKLIEYVDRNNQAEKKVKQELLDKLKAAKTEEELTVLKNEYSHPRFTSLFNKRSVEIKKENEKQDAEKKVAEANEKKSKATTKTEQVPESQKEGIDALVNRIKNATAEELKEINDNTDFIDFTEEDINKYNTAYNNRSNELSQNNAFPISLGTDPSNIQDIDPNPPRDDTGRETLNINELLDKDGTTFDYKDEAALMNSRIPNQNVSFVESLRNDALKENVKDLRETLKGLKDAIANKPAFKNEKVKQYWKDMLITPLEKRLAELEKELKDAEIIVGKEEIINESVDIEDNINPNDGNMRTSIDPNATIETEKFKKLQTEPVTTLATLHHEYILNSLLQKKTASNTPTIKYVKAISSVEYFQPGTKLRLSIDKNDERYENNKDNYLEIPIKVEGQHGSEWTPGFWLHVYSWINPFNVPYELNESTKKQMDEVRKALFEMFKTQEYVYSEVSDKFGGHPLYNIKETELDNEKVLTVDPNNNPAIEKLFLSVCMPDPNLKFVLCKNGHWYIGKDLMDNDLVNTTEDLSGKSGLVRVKVIDPAGNVRLLPISIDRLVEHPEINLSITQVIKAFYSKDQATIDKINAEYQSLKSNTRLNLSDPNSLLAYLQQYINAKQFKGFDLKLNSKAVPERHHIGLNTKGELVFGSDYLSPHKINDAQSFTNNAKYLTELLSKLTMSIKEAGINSDGSIYEVLINHNNEIVKSTEHNNYNEFIKNYTKSYINGRNKVGKEEYTYFVNPSVRMSLDFMPKDNVNLNEKEEIIKPVQLNPITNLYETGLRTRSQEQIDRIVNNYNNDIDNYNQILTFSNNFGEALDKIVMKSEEESNIAVKKLQEIAKSKGFATINEYKSAHPKEYEDNVNVVYQESRRLSKLADFINNTIDPAILHKDYQGTETVQDYINYTREDIIRVKNNKDRVKILLTDEQVKHNKKVDNISKLRRANGTFPIIVTLLDDSKFEVNPLWRYNKDNGEVLLKNGNIVDINTIKEVEITEQTPKSKPPKVKPSSLNDEEYDSVSNITIPTYKEGVDYVFEQTPELSTIGSKQEYSQYLDSIFPDSEVKDIVYHGTNSEFIEFNKNKQQVGFGHSMLGKGFYFWKNPKFTEDYGNKIVYSLINVNNPITNINGLKETISSTNYGEGQTWNKIGNDSIVDHNNGEYVVFEPDQIHILGSKQDIEGFKSWMENKNNPLNNIQFKLDTINNNLQKANLPTISLQEYSNLTNEEQEYLIKCWS